MAEIHFFADRDDSLSISAYILQRYNAEFVPDKCPIGEAFPKFNSVAGIAQSFDEDPYGTRFFVLSPTWTRQPLHTADLRTNDGRAFRYIKQRYGGPAFDLILPKVTNDEGQQWVIPASISNYPSYYLKDDYFHPAGYECFEFKRPESMNQSYIDIQNYIRGHSRRSVCEETGRPGPWILAGALSAFSQGTWLRTGAWHFVPKETSR